MIKITCSMLIIHAFSIDHMHTVFRRIKKIVVIVIISDLLLYRGNLIVFKLVLQNWMLIKRCYYIGDDCMEV